MRAKAFFKNAAVLIIAAAITASVGSVASSLKVIAALKSLNTPIETGQSASMVAYDLQHFAPLYFAFIAIAFVIAFLCAGGVYRMAKFARPLIYAVAGGVAIWVMLFLMQQVFFGVPIVAGARDITGLLLQIGAGVIGGLFFAVMTATKKRAR